MRCPRCDNLQPDNANLCAHCGHALAQPAASEPDRPSLTPPPPVRPASQPAIGMTFCGQCGQSILADVSFCPACGQAHRQATRAGSPPSPVDSSPTPRPAARIAPPIIDSAPVQRKPRKVPWAWIAGIGAAGIAIALWWLWPAPGEYSSGQQPAAIPEETVRPPEQAPEHSSALPSSDPTEDMAAQREWDEARARLDEAFREYTSLATTGGEGSVEEALERYRQRLQELQAVEQKSGLPLTR